MSNTFTILHPRLFFTKHCLFFVLAKSSSMRRKGLLALILAVILHFEECVAVGETNLNHVKTVYSRYMKRSYGDGTYYGEYPVGKGACTLDPLSPLATQSGWKRVATGQPNYQASLGCGMCVEIHGNGDGLGLNPIKGTVKAVVNDLCEGCPKEGSMDLYTKGDGRWKISFVAVDCPSVAGEAGKIQFRFQGSNPWYIKLQVRNSKIPTAGLEALIGARFHCLTRSTDNFFVGMGLGRVHFPLRIRLTSISGEQLEASIPDLKNDYSYPSNIQYSGIKVGGGPSGIKCFGQGDKGPYPPGGMIPGPLPTSGGSGGGSGVTTTEAPITQGPTTQAPPTQSPTTSGGGSTGTGFCQGKKEGVPLADPNDCHGFIICSAGQPNKFTCGPVLKFNPKANGCDHPQNVQC